MDLHALLIHYLDNPETPVDKAWVDEMARQYPFFTLPAALMLSRDTSGIDTATLEEITRRLALNTPDPAELLKVINTEAAQWIGIYPPDHQPPKVTTEQAIDKFIGTYGNPEPNEEAVIERLIFNPTPDYAQILANEEQESVPRADAAPAGSQDDRINRFIIKTRHNQGHYAPPGAPVNPHEPPVPQPDPEASSVSAPEAAHDTSTLSESLAKVYIAQRRYDKAYEIIQSLSLNYPEKSIYFADQLRFLRKLIQNQRQIDKKTTK